MKDFLIYMAQSSICLSIFGLVYLLFLRRQTFFKFNRAFLCGGLILSLFLPSIDLTYDVLVATPSTPFDWAKLAVNQEIAEAKTAGGLWHILGVVYLLGIGILMVRHMGMIVKINRLKRLGKRSAINGYQLIDNENIKTPFSILNGIFINSHQMQPKEKELILTHEICHIQQKHWLDLLCSECALLLQWFNPLMWYYIYLQKENHEYLADQAVLQNGESTAVYRAVLINQRFQGPVFSFANSFNYSNPQNRLNMMKKMKTSPWKKTAVLALLPLFGIFFALSAKPNYVMPEETQKTIVAKDTIPASDVVVIGYKGDIKLSDAKPLIVIDGRVTDMTAEELQKVDANTIESVSVLKDKTAIEEYGEKGKNGVILVQIKKGVAPPPPPITARRSKRGDAEPLIIIDGKQIDRTQKSLQDLDPDAIESISVLKDKTAIEEYGEKGKNGVIKIIMKKKKGELDALDKE